MAEIAAGKAKLKEKTFGLADSDDFLATAKEDLALAASAQLDAFEKVKKMIDEMVVVLKKDQEDEVKHRDFCVAEFDENEKQTLVKSNEIKDLKGLIAKSEATMKTIDEEMAALKDSIKEMQKQMAKASEEREAQNHEYQTVVADQVATQDILKKALKRLESFYKKALLQGHAEPGAAVPPPPPAFGEYKKNEGSSGVMTMIENVIKEAHESEKEALKDEADSQAGYEEFIKNSNSAIEKANNEIVAKTEQKAETEATMVQAKADLDSATKDSEALATYKAELHESCDFVLKNFDTRQAARMDEIEGLARRRR